jgi:hypothetical protein
VSGAWGPRDVRGAWDPPAVPGDQDPLAAPGASVRQSGGVSLAAAVRPAGEELPDLAGVSDALAAWAGRDDPAARGV